VADGFERLVPLRTGGTAEPLFCVPAVSGSAYSYAGLARLLGDDQPVYGFEAPGFDDDRTPVRSLPALSAEYAEILRDCLPEGGYRLLGWSMGGVVAFDMAQRLTAEGLKVAQVVLVDVGLPWIAELPPEREIQRRFLRDLTGIAGTDFSRLDAALSEHPVDVDAAVAFAAVERSGLLPVELDADLLEERYPVFRAHIEALFGFEVTGVYDGPVLHIRSTESEAKYMRWDKVASDLTERLVPGNHHSIWTGESLVAMSELVRTVLAPHH
jgi:thioesterase domain-containing protein